MRRIAKLLPLLLFLPIQLSARTTIRLFHFSDYHSHATPFFSEGAPDRGGIARAVGLLRREKEKGGTFVFSGGDMINRGSPAWSDKYGCAEWPWFNGIVDAMAWGNHEGDYGASAFEQCRASIRYPMLSANVVDDAGKPVFTTAGKPYAVFRSGGITIGVFALAGSDFESLVKPENRPAGSKITDRIAAAREVVRRLREDEHADAVVLIGHEHEAEDFELARSVPGITLIFGSHSHIREDLHRIEGTPTWFISPFQYLTWISHVDLTFDGHRLVSVKGDLIRIDSSIAPDRETELNVDRMEKELESDPQFAALFRKIGIAATPLSLDDQLHNETELGNYVMDVVRAATGAHLALSTTSSFRQAIPPGDVRFEDLRGSLPYPNQILLYRMHGADVRRLLQLGASRRGADSFPQISGARIKLRGTELVSADIVSDPARVSVYVPMRDDEIYVVATTDYLARIAPGYRELFAGLSAETTGREVRDSVRQAIEGAKSIRGILDGRISEAPSLPR